MGGREVSRVETNQELGHNLSWLDTNGWNSNGGSRDGENGMGLEDVEETESTGLGDGKIQGRFEDNEGNERGFSLGYT